MVATKQTVRSVKRVKVGSHRGAKSLFGPQGQRLIPTITQATTGASGISACLVIMPPGKISKPHLHLRTEIIVIVIEGHAATLIGERLRPTYHGPGEFLFVPEGVVHAAVNLDPKHRLVAIEVRTDPRLNDDVVPTPELEQKLTNAAARLHKRFAAGTLKLPAHWDVKHIKPFTFSE